MQTLVLLSASVLSKLGVQAQELSENIPAKITVQQHDLGLCKLLPIIDILLLSYHLHGTHPFRVLPS